MLYETKTVVRRIKELLGSNTETSMAKFLGIPQVTLNYCLAGKRKPSLELIFHICDKYKVSADWLLGLTDDRGDSQSVAPMKMVTKKRQTLLEPQDEILIKFAALEKRVKELESSAIRYLNQPATACCG